MKYKIFIPILLLLVLVSGASAILTDAVMFMDFENESVGDTSEARYIKHWGTHNITGTSAYLNNNGGTQVVSALDNKALNLTISNIDLGLVNGMTGSTSWAVGGLIRIENPSYASERHLLSAWGTTWDYRMRTSSGTAQMFPSGTLNYKAWTDTQDYHYMLMANTTHMTIYIDGVLQGNYSTYGGIYPNNVQVKIGSRPITSKLLYGTIDNVFMYNHNLTQAEITWLASGGNPYNITTTSSCSVLSVSCTPCSGGYNQTNLDSAFVSVSNFASYGNISAWDTSCITSMSNTFQQANNIPDISTWNTSNVTKMDYMFYLSDFNQDISSWDISSLKNVVQMFRENVLFNQDLSAWDTSNIDYFFNMFYQATSFDQSLAGFEIDTANNLPSPLVGISTNNYDDTLEYWASYSTVPTGLSFNAGTSLYTNQSARDILTSTYSWSITDGGSVPVTPSQVTWYRPVVGTVLTINSTGVPLLFNWSEAIDNNSDVVTYNLEINKLLGENTNFSVLANTSVNITFNSANYTNGVYQARVYSMDSSSFNVTNLPHTFRLCVNDYVGMNTSCNGTFYTTYYTDSNSCPVAYGKPTNTSTACTITEPETPSSGSGASDYLIIWIILAVLFLVLALKVSGIFYAFLGITMVLFGLIGLSSYAFDETSLLILRVLSIFAGLVMIFFAFFDDK